MDDNTKSCSVAIAIDHLRGFLRELPTTDETQDTRDAVELLIEVASQPPAVPVALMCDDLLLADCNITQDRHHADRVALAAEREKVSEMREAGERAIERIQTASEAKVPAMARTQHDTAAAVLTPGELAHAAWADILKSIDTGPIGWPGDDATKPTDIIAAALRQAEANAYECGRAAGQVDGERWRALMSSARIHILGTAGFDPSTCRNPPDYRHFGAEFWTHHDTPSEDGPRIVTAYADAIRTGNAGDTPATQGVGNG